MVDYKNPVTTDSLSIDRIDGQADDDIISCPICTNVLWKPITCKACENSFCLKCIRLWLAESPNKCPFNCRFQERKPPPILIKLLSKLKLTCQYKSSGCTNSIPYEALEKHQLHECLYRITQCSRCSEDILYKDLETHQHENCLLKQLKCLKCNTTYYQKDGHDYSECSKKYSILTQEAIETSTTETQKIRDTFNTSIPLYERSQTNEEYARRTQLSNDMQEFTPSAQVNETSSPLLSQSGSSKISQPPTTAASVPPIMRPANVESPSISTVNFSTLSRSVKESGYSPNDCARFSWENIYYMFEEYTSGKHHLKGFSNAYTNSRKCVAYNGNGKPMSMLLMNPQNTFGLHSFEAMSIYHDDFKLSVTGYRSNMVVAVKNVTLTNKKPTLFEIDWKQIDKLKFTPKLILETCKPATFALTCLNLVL